MNSLISKQSVNHQERKEILKSFLLSFMELLHWMPSKTFTECSSIIGIQGSGHYDSKLKNIFCEQWVHTWIDRQSKGWATICEWLCVAKPAQEYCKVNSIESQQAMAILKVGKLDSMNLNTQKPELISNLSRGGLWTVTMRAFRSFWRLMSVSINQLQKLVYRELTLFELPKLNFRREYLGQLSTYSIQGRLL